jgi:hypothetical protein
MYYNDHQSYPDDDDNGGIVAVATMAVRMPEW